MTDPICVQIINWHSILLSFTTAVLVVPITLKLHDKIILDSYLKELVREIQENLNLISELEKNLEKVRSGKRLWLPGIPSNRPQPGYFNSYLSSNVYDHFIEQRHWMYIERGTRGCLSELYEWIRRYCEVIHTLQVDQNPKIENCGAIIDKSDNRLIHEPKKSKNFEDFYSSERFSKSLSCIENRIYENAKKVNLDNPSSCKVPFWWCPEVLQSLISDD